MKQLLGLVSQKRDDIESWKADRDFDLNQHRLKNDIKNIRMQLISYEDQCDTFCQEN